MKGSIFFKRKLGRYLETAVCFKWTNTYKNSHGKLVDTQLLKLVALKNSNKKNWNEKQ